MYSGEVRMKLSVTLFLLIGSVSAIAQTTKPTLNDLSWLAGCWEANLRGREVKRTVDEAGRRNHAGNGAHGRTGQNR